MANPNIVNVSDIKGKTVGVSLTNTSATVLNNNTASTIYKINSVYSSNYSASSAPVSLAFNDGSNSFTVVSTVNVPASATLITISKNEAIYLEPGQSLEGNSDDGTSIKLVISYEEIS